MTALGRDHGVPFELSAIVEQIFRQDQATTVARVRPATPVLPVMV